MIRQDAECSKVLVECQYCDLEVLRGDYVEHQNDCGSRTDFCDFCNQRVMLKDLAEHKQTGCRLMGQVNPEAERNVDDINASQGKPLYSPRNGALHSFYPDYSRPPSYDTHTENSVHVDPQWLASVANVYGEDNIDDLLVQSFRALENPEDSSGAAMYSSEGVSGERQHTVREGEHCGSELESYTYIYVYMYIYVYVYIYIYLFFLFFLPKVIDVTEVYPKE